MCPCSFFRRLFGGSKVKRNAKARAKSQQQRTREPSHVRTVSWRQYPALTMEEYRRLPRHDLSEQPFRTTRERRPTINRYGKPPLRGDHRSKQTASSGRGGSHNSMEARPSTPVHLKPEYPQRPQGLRKSQKGERSQTGGRCSSNEATSELIAIWMILMNIRSRIN
ncbi:hypothetical protein PG993_008850 [Apiospora rasikravindrae]|uniref:Uncharacterized protein n=1 Tax=Apiospora rasikravindrae TaxID=990691 RepID=A0ABR1SPH6_9PEZI